MDWTAETLLGLDATFHTNISGTGGGVIIIQVDIDVTLVRFLSTSLANA